MGVRVSTATGRERPREKRRSLPVAVPIRAFPPHTHLQFDLNRHDASEQTTCQNCKKR